MRPAPPNPEELPEEIREERARFISLGDILALAALVAIPFAVLGFVVFAAIITGIQP